MEENAWGDSSGGWGTSSGFDEPETSWGGSTTTYHTELDDYLAKKREKGDTVEPTQQDDTFPSWGGLESSFDPEAYNIKPSYEEETSYVEPEPEPASEPTRDGWGTSPDLPPIVAPAAVAEINLEWSVENEEEDESDAYSKPPPLPTVAELFGSHAPTPDVELDGWGNPISLSAPTWHAYGQEEREGSVREERNSSDEGAEAGGEDADGAASHDEAKAAVAGQDQEEESTRNARADLARATARNSGVLAPSGRSNNAILGSIQSGFGYTTQKTTQALQKGIDYSTQRATDAIQHQIDQATQRAQDAIQQQIDQTKQMAVDAIHQQIDQTKQMATDAFHSGIQRTTEASSQALDASTAMVKSGMRETQNSIQGLTRKVSESSQDTKPAQARSSGGWFRRFRRGATEEPSKSKEAAAKEKTASLDVTAPSDIARAAFESAQKERAAELARRAYSASNSVAVTPEVPDVSEFGEIPVKNLDAVYGKDSKSPKSGKEKFGVLWNASEEDAYAEIEETNTVGREPESYFNEDPSPWGGSNLATKPMSLLPPPPGGHKTVVAPVVDDDDEEFEEFLSAEPAAAAIEPVKPVMSAILTPIKPIHPIKHPQPIKAPQPAQVSVLQTASSASAEEKAVSDSASAISKSGDKASADSEKAKVASDSEQTIPEPGAAKIPSDPAEAKTSLDPTETISEAAETNSELTEATSETTVTTTPSAERIPSNTESAQKPLSSTTLPEPIKPIQSPIEYIKPNITEPSLKPTKSTIPISTSTLSKVEAPALPDPIKPIAFSMVPLEPLKPTISHKVHSEPIKPIIAAPTLKSPTITSPVLAGAFDPIPPAPRVTHGATKSTISPAVAPLQPPPVTAPLQPPPVTAPLQPPPVTAPLQPLPVTLPPSVVTSSSTKTEAVEEDEDDDGFGEFESATPEIPSQEFPTISAPPRPTSAQPAVTSPSTVLSPTRSAFMHPPTVMEPIRPVSVQPISIKTAPLVPLKPTSHSTSTSRVSSPQVQQQPSKKTLTLEDLSFFENL